MNATVIAVVALCFSVLGTLFFVLKCLSERIISYGNTAYLLQDSTELVTRIDELVNRDEESAQIPQDAARGYRNRLARLRCEYEQLSRRRFALFARIDENLASPKYEIMKQIALYIPLYATTAPQFTSILRCALVTYREATSGSSMNQVQLRWLLR